MVTVRWIHVGTLHIMLSLGHKSTQELQQECHISETHAGAEKGIFLCIRSWVSGEKHTWRKYLMLLELIKTNCSLFACSLILLLDSGAMWYCNYYINQFAKVSGHAPDLDAATTVLITVCQCQRSHTKPGYCNYRLSLSLPECQRSHTRPGWYRWFAEKIMLIHFGS